MGDSKAAKLVNRLEQNLKLCITLPITLPTTISITILITYHNFYHIFPQHFTDFFTANRSLPFVEGRDNPSVPSGNSHGPAWPCQICERSRRLYLGWILRRTGDRREIACAKEEIGVLLRFSSMFRRSLHKRSFRRHWKENMS